MKFGVREICDVVFKAKQKVKIGQTTFEKNQPVLYIDSAKTSTIEGAATSVYAQGGKGNTRLIAWEGEKTLTFTVEDALLSPIGFAILSGAGLFNGSTGTTKVRVHTTAEAYVAAGVTEIELKDVLGTDKTIDEKAPVFIMKVDKGSIVGAPLEASTVSGTTITLKEAPSTSEGTTVFVDFYVQKDAKTVSELQIDAENFAGNYYVEASTLFRDTEGGDLPAEITIPNVKIQSNFTFSMASTGDPSTFTFTMDAFPGYTMFDSTKKVLCVIQIVDESKQATRNVETVMGTEEEDSASSGDSYSPSPAVSS